MPAHRTLREIVTWGPKITEITESQRRLSLKSDLKPNAIFTDHFTSINWIKTYAEADGGCIQEFRGAIPTITEITTCPRMIPAHKGDDGGREWRPGYVGWYHRLSQQYLWRSDSTRMIPVHVQGRQREQKPNMVIPVGDSLSGSAKAVPAGHEHVLFSSFLLPPSSFELHSLEQSVNKICYDQYLLEQSADRDCLFTTRSSLWVPGFLDASASVSA